MNLRNHIRKVVYSLALLAGASGVFSPLFASASILGIFGQPSQQTQITSTLTYNSQDVPLLSPAVNLDPNPAVGGGDISVVAGQALLAQEGPSGTAADLPSAPVSSQISVYTVHPGDTLSGIAQMFNVSVGTIVGANDIQGQTIQPGEQLIILPITGIQYTVKKGDTIASIAKDFKSDAGDIAQYNDLAVDAPLAAGTQLVIPNGETPMPVSAPATVPIKPKTPVSRGSSHYKVGPEPYLGGSGPAIAGYYSWPLVGGIITQGLHGWNAVDIGAPTGTSILAAAQGTVIVARDNGGWNGGYGNYVVISHPNGTQTLYAHMSRVLASPGEQVAQGTVIGKVGATGMATGPHLHFEVRGAANPFASLGVGYSQ